MLPPNLYPEQVKQFCDKVLTSNRANFEETITSKAINRKECYHTVHFLLLNHLAVEIYPINGSFAYNIFTLIDLPSWEFIDKFNVRIFPGSNFIKCANMYSNYKPFRDEDDCLKYLLVKEVIKEVKIYVYRKCFVESESGATGKNAETTTSMSLAGAAGVIGTNISKSIDNILQRSVNGHYDINEIVSR